MLELRGVDLLTVDRGEHLALLHRPPDKVRGERLDEALHLRVHVCRARLVEGHDADGAEQFGEVALLDGRGREPERSDPSGIDHDRRVAGHVSLVRPTADRARSGHMPAVILLLRAVAAEADQGQRDDSERARVHDGTAMRTTPTARPSLTHAAPRRTSDTTCSMRVMRSIASASSTDTSGTCPVA